jgi:hypothetical protein
MTTMPAYFKIDDCARQFFRCDALRSTLSREACAGNFSGAQNLAEEQVTCRHLCRRCPIGAAHAGVRLMHESPFRGASTCPRCGKFSTRIINGTRCVSCYNREREFVRGRNGKGTKPTIELAARRLGVIVNLGASDARYLELRADLSKETLELALSTLRVASGRIGFHRALGRPATTTADFVAMMDPAPEARGANAARPVAMFRSAKRAPALPAPPRRERLRLPAVDRLPNEVRHAPGVLDLETARERLMARRVSA